MDAKKVKLVVIKSHCDLYKEGDEIVFDGPVIDKAKSGALHDGPPGPLSLCLRRPPGFALAVGYPVSRLRRRRHLPRGGTMMHNPNRAEREGIGKWLDDRDIMKGRMIVV